MADRQWFVFSADKQYGPFSDERLRQLIAGRQVMADTFVWCQGMKDWTPAGDIPGLVPDMRPPAIARAAAPADGSGQAFSTTVGVWPLFGRVLLLWICGLLVIPLPWVAIGFLRWFVDHIELPGQQRVSLAGKLEHIWPMFIGYGLCVSAAAVISLLVRHSAYPFVSSTLLQWQFIPFMAIFALAITRWFYANLVWEGQTAQLKFTGGYLAQIGWMLLAAVSIFSIVGWAWVYTAWARWMCRNVTGANREFVFTASGLNFLGRTLLFSLLCALVVPIPWAFRSYTRWLVSQFALTA